MRSKLFYALILAGAHFDEFLRYVTMFMQACALPMLETC